MTRWKAAAIHLSISLAIALLSAALIFGIWYPSPYSQAAGAVELVLLLLGVDVVLGPLLTLVVFKSGKKTLRFDLTVVALLQICAFSYGMSVVVRARPVFIVSVVDQFVLVSASELDPTDLAKATKPEFQSPPWTGPKVVGSVLPTGMQEKMDLIMTAMAGKDAERYPQYYVDYASAAQALLTRAKPIAALTDKHAEAKEPIESWLRANHRDAAGVVWVPLKTHRQFFIMLLDNTSGTPLDALPIDPW